MKRFSASKLLALFLAAVMAVAAFPVIALGNAAGGAASSFGYIFDLSDYIADKPAGPLGEDGGGTDTLGTTHGAANSNLEIGLAGANRYLQVNRTQENSTRGLLLRGIEYQVGDIIIVEGTLFTPGLNIRLQPAGGGLTMPSHDEMGVPDGGATEGLFRIEYTVTEIFAEEANAGGMRVVAHNQAIPAAFRLYTLTVYRPDPDGVPFVPGPQVVRTVAYEFYVTGVEAETTFEFTGGTLQLRQNIANAGVQNPASLAFSVAESGAFLWELEYTPPETGFLGWQNMGEIVLPAGVGLELTAFILNGIRLIPTTAFDFADRNLPSRFQRASEDVGHVFARCACGNASLELITLTHTIPAPGAPEGVSVGGSDFDEIPIPNRIVVGFLQAEDTDTCHIPFTWGQAGGAALHDATNLTTFRGDAVTVVHTGDSNNDDPHVLRFGGIALTDADREAIARAENAVLTLDTAAAGNRMIWVWTDLSNTVPGASGNPAELAFLTNANAAAGAIIGATDLGPPALINIPIELLYIPPAVSGMRGVYAQYVYVMTTLAAHGGLEDLEGLMTPGGLRRDRTNEINRASIEFVEPADFVRNISLNIGVDQSEMRITWWSPVGEADAAVVQVARFDQLVGGQMPANARTIRGTQPWHGPAPIGSAAAHMGAAHPVPNIAPIDLEVYHIYAYDVNRINVTGLSAGTRYAYRVGNRVDGAYVWSNIYHFDTFDLSDGTQTVLLIGDPQIGGQSIPRMRQNWPMALGRALDRADGYGGAHFILNVADNWSAANIVYRMEIYLSPPELRNIPMFTTIGNHDTVTQRQNPGELSPFALLTYIYYWPNHTWLDCLVSGLTGHSRHASNYQRGGGNHFFVYGDVLYISLNTNHRDQIIEHRETLLRATTMHPDTTWRIVQFHQDVFGSGTGHAAGMPASGRQQINVLMEEFDIDIVFNGHEHTHGRSHFMTGGTIAAPGVPGVNPTPVMQQRPADFGRNREGRLIFDAHPGAFIAPTGIPYITLGTIADFPKYTSILDPMLPWVAWTDPPQFDYYAQYSIMHIDGDSLTVNTYVIPHAHGTPGANATLMPTSDPSFRSTSFTVRQTARFEDLELLISGARDFAQGDVTNASWANFQAAIAAGELLTAASPAADIHAAFMHIYDMYFALENTADFTALATLVEQAEALLETAVEGPWYGQFPLGYIGDFRAVFTPAALVNSIRLSTQAVIDAQYALLRPAFDAFTASASIIARPWIDVHNIPATGVYTLGLLNWMDDYIPLRICHIQTLPDDEFPTYDRFIRPWEHHPNVTPRFYAHFTKVNFAGGSLRAEPHPEAGANHHTNFLVEREAVRPCEPYGPANALGGRSPIPFGYNAAGVAQFTSGHITHTHAGEWIRYELNVAQAGEFRLQLGAINPNDTAQIVLIRDTSYNTLTRFVIPAGHGAAQGWTDANPLIEAENTIFLPAGNVIIEMLFINDGPVRADLTGAAGTGPVHHGTGNVSSYPDGPNVDILTLERVGDMAPVVITTPDNMFILPLLPNDAAGNALRQRGWAMEGVGNEWGTVEYSTFTHEVAASATHLVLEVAARPGGNVDFVLAGGHSGSWTQISIPIADIFDPEAMTLTIDLSDNPAHALWRDISDGAARRIIVSHNSESWDEMNVIRAFFLLGADAADGAVALSPVVTIPAGEGLVSVVPPAPVAGQPLLYTVQPGESLRSIAFNFYGSMGAAAVNRILNANRNVIPANRVLQPGMVLTLPAQGLRDPITRTHLNNAQGLYLVQSGDTLSSIALRFLGSAAQWRRIYEANRARIANPGMINSGQWLVIPN